MPTQASLLGPTQSGQYNTLVLDASNSADPDEPTAPLVYVWHLSAERDAACALLGGTGNMRSFKSPATATFP